MPTHLRTRLWPVCLAGLVLTACAAPKAAEPAVAPQPAVPPAGQVITAGDQPEGIVADPATHLVAIGVRNPTGLLLMDGRTGRVAARVPLPGHVRHLQLAALGGPVLVPDEDAHVLLTVALPGGAVLSRVTVGDYPHDATAASDGTTAVTDELGGTLAFVRDGHIAHRFTDPTQPGGLAATGHLVALVDVGADTLSLYDTQRDTRIFTADAGAGPTHVVAGRRGQLYVADTRGNQILTFTTTPRLRQTAATPLPGTPYGIAYDAARDRLWITLTARNQVVGFTLSGGRLRELIRLPTVRQPNTVAVDAGTGRLFVASRTGGTVQLIDPPS